MGKFDSWTPPSEKNRAKLPQINLVNSGTAVKYVNWFRDHPEIDRAVPPVFDDFCINYTVTFPRECGKKEATYAYTDIVHYAEDRQSFVLCHVFNGRKILIAEVDYERIQPDGNVFVYSRSPENTQFDHDWLQNEALSAAFCVLSTQAFILYHKPEIKPVYLSSPADPRKNSASPRKPAKRATVLNPERRKLVYLDGKMPTERIVHYRKIKWGVRGHYRRIIGRGGESKTIYIKPHTAKRGEKKSAQAEIDIKAVPTEKEKKS